jgi:putative SOS response-associated peptidase YedK
MCGRYYVEMDDAEIREIADKARSKAKADYREISLKTSGEIYPSDTVPVQIGADEYVPMRWGFTLPGKKLLINARFETYKEKNTFKNCKPCLIPASGYFEWKQGTDPKVKYAFTVSETPMFLAGLTKEEDTPRFVILTHDAVGAAREIHHRMPVIIPKAEIKNYLEGAFNTSRILTAVQFREADRPTGQIKLDI